MTLLPKILKVFLEKKHLKNESDGGTEPNPASHQANSLSLPSDEDEIKKERMLTFLIKAKGLLYIMK